MLEPAGEQRKCHCSPGLKGKAKEQKPKGTEEPLSPSQASWLQAWPIFHACLSVFLRSMVSVRGGCVCVIPAVLLPALGWFGKAPFQQSLVEGGRPCSPFSGILGQGRRSPNARVEVMESPHPWLPLSAAGSGSVSYGSFTSCPQGFAAAVCPSVTLWGSGPIC